MTQGTDKPDVISIDRDEYERLVEAEQKLAALEAAGVDNWEGYSDAMGAWALDEKKEPVVDAPAPDANDTPAQAAPVETGDQSAEPAGMPS